jgi:hypothetical protein
MTFSSFCLFKFYEIDYFSTKVTGNRRVKRKLNKRPPRVSVIKNNSNDAETSTKFEEKLHGHIEINDGQRDCTTEHGYAVTERSHAVVHQRCSQRRHNCHSDAHGAIEDSEKIGKATHLWQRDERRQVVPFFKTSPFEETLVTDVPFICPLCPPRRHRSSPAIEKKGTSYQHQSDTASKQPENDYAHWDYVSPENSTASTPTNSSFLAATETDSIPSQLSILALELAPHPSYPNYPGYWYTTPPHTSPPIIQPITTRTVRTSSDPSPLSALTPQHEQSNHPQPQLQQRRTSSSFKATLRRRASSAASDVAVQARGFSRRVVGGLTGLVSRREEGLVVGVVKRRGVRWVIDSECVSLEEGDGGNVGG